METGKPSLSSGGARKRTKLVIGVVAIVALVALVAVGVTVAAVYWPAGTEQSKGGTGMERERFTSDRGVLSDKVSH